MTWELFGGLLGGVGLFLLGMRLMTDGLRLAAGRALRNILSKWTRTPLRGVGSGFLVTAMVQSSAAVTVASIGFVNAGLLSLERTLWVVFGSNIGTTVTAWLVVLIGFKLKIKLFALPMIGLGMALNLTGSGADRRAAIGEAIAGFGIFFLSIEMLKDGFGGLQGSFDFAALDVHGIPLILLSVGIGFLLTALMLSSSASIAIVLAAAAEGIMPVNAAAAAIIGANLGATVTAVMMVLGATPNAIRVAVGHVLFNCITAVVALLCLPIFLWGIEGSMRIFVDSPDPASVLAIFHTWFNVLGVIIITPMFKGLTAFLKRHFRSEHERLSRPKYLDKSILQTPSLALGAITLELGRVGEFARDMTIEAVGMGRPSYINLVVYRDAVQRLDAAIIKAVAKLQGYNLPDEISSVLPNILNIGQYYMNVADLAPVTSKGRKQLKRIVDPFLEGAVLRYSNRAKELIALTDPCIKVFDEESCQVALEAVWEAYAELKSVVLDAGVRGVLSPSQMAGRLELYSRERRLLEQLHKAAMTFAGLPDFARACPSDFDAHDDVKEYDMDKFRPGTPM